MYIKKIQMYIIIKKRHRQIYQFFHTLIINKQFSYYLQMEHQKKYSYFLKVTHVRQSFTVKATHL